MTFPPLKFAVLFSGLALVAAPAAAQVTHRVSVAHAGSSVAISYEPKVETSFRETGWGPRSIAGCRWTSRVSIQRIAQGADGQPIAALTRMVAGHKTRSGQVAGHCTQVKEGFAADEQALRSHVEAAARADAPALRTELASLAALKAA